VSEWRQPDKKLWVVFNRTTQVRSNGNQIKNYELLLIADSSCPTRDNQIKNPGFFLTKLLMFEVITIKLKTLSCC